MMKPKWSRF